MRKPVPALFPWTFLGPSRLFPFVLGLAATLSFVGCEKQTSSKAVDAKSSNSITAGPAPTSFGATNSVPPGFTPNMTMTTGAPAEADLRSMESTDPVFGFMADIERKPSETHPKDWQQTKSLMIRPAPKVGQPAPDFSLPMLNGGQLITRSAYQAGRPLVLIFGSFTCPPFRRWSDDLEAFFQRNKDRAAFLFVYIQEAHPADGWQIDANVREGVVINKPREWNERQQMAQACCRKLNLSIPCVVDTMENTVDNLYIGWPERIFVIGRDGMIAYAGKLGPFGFKPGEAEGELRQLH